MGGDGAGGGGGDGAGGGGGDAWAGVFVGCLSSQEPTKLLPVNSSEVGSVPLSLWPVWTLVWLERGGCTGGSYPLSVGTGGRHHDEPRSLGVHGEVQASPLRDQLMSPERDAWRLEVHNIYSVPSRPTNMGQRLPKRDLSRPQSRWQSFRHGWLSCAWLLAALSLPAC